MGRILLFRRKPLVVLACALTAALMFYVVNYPYAATASATISSLLSWDIWAWESEWFITSWPASARALTDSGYLSTQAPTTKKVAVTSYCPRMSISCWVSSFPQGDVK